MSCAASCYLIYKSVADTLYIFDENGEPQPNLVESAEPNADFTRWTLTIRDGISFHDGSPHTGEAVAYNLLTCKASPLTGPALTFLSDIQGSGQTVTLTFTQPSPTALYGMAEGSCAVRNVTDLTVPGSGTPVLTVDSGRHWIAQIWCTDGDCGS